MPSISGFRASDIGQYGIADFSWWEGGNGIIPDPWSFGQGGFSPFDFSLGDAVATAINSIFGSTGSGTRVPPVVISEQPRTVLPPNGNTGAFPIPPTVNLPEGWETVVIGGEQRVRVPETYQSQGPVVLEPIDPEDLRTPVPVPVDDNQENDMAIDWGGLLNTGVDFLQGQLPRQAGIMGPPQFVSPTAAGQWGPGGVAPPAPSKVTVDTRTGKVTPCYRRRRRRLLTPTDINDLAALKAIVGGGQAMNLAVAKAVRR